MTVNGFQPLAIITKCSILDVAAALDPPLQVDTPWPHTMNIHKFLRILCQESF